MKNIGILGSTGSIGTQTLDIVREYPDLFKVSALSARNNWELLARQAREFSPEMVVIADPGCYHALKEALSDTPVRVEAGEEALCECAALPLTDLLVTATVGYSGLLPTINAIKAGKTIALANKETLVAGGELISRMLKKRGADIIPVDSEHSAIFQCLVGENHDSLEKIILTASGGPFRTLPAERLPFVTAADALHHPNWTMGAKVTIDSASMMNKGFEMIEARWLFDCEPDKIEIMVHPQSVVHSMVQFTDGSVKAQLGVPDMHLPIRYALGYPERLNASGRKLTVADMASLTFETPDMEKFPLLEIAYETAAAGGYLPCALNAANEVAVASFLAGEIRFTDMKRVVENVLSRTPITNCEVSLDGLIAVNSESVCRAREYVKQIRL
ncbi:MAG: 1-deoxy-D-xylulose-5-phosphate reductoisomerase [Candidatus Amulumruptor caecigallinarius]|nr:1-deoxy-D-xylulose-5-phosphate reductoisomerase [Candidatus Amulumruptor caecigallinarius]